MLTCRCKNLKSDNTGANVDSTKLLVKPLIKKITYIVTQKKTLQKEVMTLVGIICNFGSCSYFRRYKL